MNVDEDLICELIEELFIQPRKSLRKWSKITHQTMQVRIGYPGQHLASLITECVGTGSAARGKDLVDGSEIKTCSRMDQFSKCKTSACEAGILPDEDECPQCGNTDIDRKTDSHWIFTIRTQEELQNLIESPKILLILFDRLEEDETVGRIRCWEIVPDSSRHSYFKEFLTDFFDNNYSVKKSAGKSSINPCNFHPLKFDFYMSNPILVFDCLLNGLNSDEPNIDKLHWVKSGEDRDKIASVEMPVKLLSNNEIDELIVKGKTPKELSDILGDCLDHNIGGQLYEGENAAKRHLELKSYRAKLPKMFRDADIFILEDDDVKDSLDMRPKRHHVDP